MSILKRRYYSALNSNATARCVALLKDPTNWFEINELIYYFQLACAKLHYDIAEELLNHVKLPLDRALDIVKRHNCPGVFNIMLHKKIALTTAEQQQTALYLACRYGYSKNVSNMLKSPLIDIDYVREQCLPHAYDKEQFFVCGAILEDTRIAVEQNNMIPLDRLRIIIWRVYIVCVALQDLHLPTLVTLEVVDALLPNTVTMAQKWKLIAKIKHFKNKFDY